jgi:hypothetical protein
VTCGGDFDRARGSYRDNLVVFARLGALTAPDGRYDGPAARSSREAIASAGSGRPK